MPVPEYLALLSWTGPVSPSTGGGAAMQLSRDGSGLILRREAGSTSIGFTSTDWEADESVSLFTDGGGNLNVGGLPAAPVVVHVTRKDAPSRATQMVMGEFRIFNQDADDIGEMGSAHVPASTDPDDGLRCRYYTDHDQEQFAGLVEQHQGVFNAIDQDPTNPADQYDQFHRIALWKDGSTAAGYEHLDALTFSGATQVGPGKGGIYVRRGGGGLSFSCRRFFHFEDRYVTVTGVPSSGSVEILNAANTVLDSAGESGGSATLDVLDLAYPGPVKIRVKNAVGDVLDTLEPPDGVWGGDTYSFS